LTIRLGVAPPGMRSWIRWWGSFSDVSHPRRIGSVLRCDGLETARAVTWDFGAQFAPNFMHAKITNIILAALSGM